MILSEMPAQFHDRLRLNQASKSECVAAVDASIANKRPLEAIYILDRALVRFPSSKFLHTRVSDLVGSLMNSVGSAKEMLDLQPMAKEDFSEILNKVENRFFPLHGVNSTEWTDNTFLNCVIFKTMCMMVENKEPIWNVLARLSEEFGRRSVNISFGGTARSAEIKNNIAKILIGGNLVKHHISNNFIDFRIKYFFAHEPGLLRLISSFNHDDIFIDIGANIGSFSIVAAKTKKCRVFSLEPYSVNYTELQRNISLNNATNLVTPLRVALSDTTKEGALSYQRQYPGAATQTFDGSNTDAAQNGNSMEQVQGYRLDDLISEGLVDFPNHIKIDVDGTEHQIIAGMQHTLNDPRLRSIRLEIRVEDPRNAAALRSIEAAGFTCKVGDDLKNMNCVRD
ncbi:FkbM family methyltransferase [uncultured Nisaea sp.]|uniref:FkbM family methyltransferase n=1 Tax=uncultured Nisaea sp. TaxID=538215 RepID=UPI0030EF0C89|tara:strand:+ start:760 stop:1947 length:1188 start_codon:yes stop_codon:yes gene_type:complete